MRAFAKILTAIAVLLGVFLQLANAQTPTSVSATIQDPNGFPYSFATVKAQLLSSGTPTIIVNGIPVQIQGQQNATADVNGKFNMNLFCNVAASGCSVISPSGSQWQITIAISPGVLPPEGTGPQECSATITVTGLSQDVAGSFSCPKLSNAVGTGGGPGMGIQNCLADWATTQALGSVCGFAGQIPIAQNGAAPAFGSPGINGDLVSTSTYPVSCGDGSSTLGDRGRTKTFTNGSGTTVTLLDTTATGCGNFFVGLEAGSTSGTVTVNNTSTSTFTVLNGTSSLTGQTSFTIPPGAFATVSAQSDGSWLVRETTASGTLTPCILNGSYFTGQPAASPCYATVQATITAANGNGTVDTPATYAGVDIPTGSRIAVLNTPILGSQPNETIIDSDSRWGTKVVDSWNPNYDGLTNLQYFEESVVNWNEFVAALNTSNNVYSRLHQTNFLSGTRNFNANSYLNKTNIGMLWETLNSWSPAQVNAVQLGANCYGAGDCIPSNTYAMSFGGMSAGSDEGMHANTYSAAQGNVEYAGTISSGGTTGSTSITVSPTQGSGTQGVGGGRVLYDITKAYSTGTLASVSGTPPTFVGTSTGWTPSTNTTTSTAITVASTTTTTAAITTPGSQSVAVASSAGIGVGAVLGVVSSAPGKFEAVVVTAVPDGTHITANFTMTHASGVTLKAINPGQQSTTVGSCSGISPGDVVRVSDTAIWEDVTVISCSSTTLTALFTIPHATSSTVADCSTPGTQACWFLDITNDEWTTGGQFGFISVTTPLRQLWPVTSVTDATHLTVLISGGFSGGDGYSGGGRFPGQTYNLYPGAAVTDVTNSGATVVNTLTVSPNATAWATSDSVAESLGPYFKFSVGNKQFVRWWYEPGSNAGGDGETWSGRITGNWCGWCYTNNTALSQYGQFSGAGINNQIPATFLGWTGAVKVALKLNSAPTLAVIQMACPYQTSGAQNCTNNGADPSFFAPLARFSGTNGDDAIIHSPNSNQWGIYSGFSGTTPTYFFFPKIKGASASSVNPTAGAAHASDVPIQSGYLQCTQANCPASGAPTTIYTTAATSHHLISVVGSCTATGSTSFTLSLKYTDPSNTVITLTTGSANCTSFGAASSTQITQGILVLTGTAIQVFATGTSSPSYIASFSDHQISQ